MQKDGVGNKVFHYVYSSMYFLFQDKSYKRRSLFQYLLSIQDKYTCLRRQLR